MIEFQEALRRILKPAGAGPSPEARAVVLAGAQAADDVILSYGAFDTLIGRAQAGLSAAAVTRGDLVVLCSPNSPELVAAILAAWRLGAVAVPVDYRITTPELENIASRVKAKVLCAPDKRTDKLAVVTPNEWPSKPAAFDDEALVRLTPDATALVILTSGTTGMPKGAVHDLGSLINNVSELGFAFGLSASDSAYLPLPVSHIFGIEVMLAALLYGGAVAFADFKPAEFWNCIVRLKSTMVVGVPTIYGALLSMPSPPLDEIGVEWYLSGGAPLPVTLNEDFQKRFGMRVVQGYGTTETKILCFNKDGPLASVGRALPSVKVSIIADGKDAGEGQSGEIVISGPSLMKGYLGQDDATRQVLKDGFYTTGDIGYLESGYLFISGRSKEMINVAGNKVFPAEVESVLRQHPLVAETAVVGVPHSRLGQMVKAVIVLKPSDLSDSLSGSEPTRKAGRQELISKFRLFCQENLKRELRPMEWDFRPSSMPLPKTHTGKIDKKLLEDTNA